MCREKRSGLCWKLKFFRETVEIPFRTYPYIFPAAAQMLVIFNRAFKDFWLCLVFSPLAVSLIRGHKVVWKILPGDGIIWDLGRNNFTKHLKNRALSKIQRTAFSPPARGIQGVLKQKSNRSLPFAADHIKKRHNAAIFQVNTHPKADVPVPRRVKTLNLIFY